MTFLSIKIGEGYTEEVPASVPYDDYLIESLKNRRRAKAYLNAALEDGDPRVVLLALRNVARARGLSGEGKIIEG